MPILRIALSLNLSCPNVSLSTILFKLKFKKALISPLFSVLASIRYLQSGTIEQAVLFGSYAQGTFNDWSDIDKRFETFKLGVLLKQARIEAGMTQEQIAEQLKTSKSVISRMENHATDIRLSTLEKFAKAVGRDIQVALV